MSDDKPEVKTPHGTFRPVSKNCVAISVVRTTRAVGHHGRRVAAGEFTIIEHRKIPGNHTFFVGGWYNRVATYQLDGTEIVIKPSENESEVVALRRQLAAAKKLEGFDGLNLPALFVLQAGMQCVHDTAMSGVGHGVRVELNAAIARKQAAQKQGLAPR